MVGSADPANRAIDGAYNVVLAPRQPGSAIKPFTYLAALDRWSPGAANLHLTPASLLDDVPSTFHAPGGALYQPMDYDAHFLGRVPLRVALGSSLNVPAVQTLQRVGIARMLQVAHAAGITTMYRADRYGPALTLGGGDVTLLDLTAAYGTIAAGGMRHVARAILSVTDAQGHELGDWAPPPLSGKARSAFGPRGPQLAALMTDILGDDSARLPAFGANSVLVLPGRPAAVKTGTTSDWHDNWTVGYTPDLVVGVWVGNADNAPMMDISGITGAAPIWHDVMTAALRGVAPRPFTLPPGMVRETVCQDTGLPALPSCRNPISELFIADTQPSAASPQSVAAGPVIADPPDGAQFALSSAIPVAAQRIAVTIRDRAPADGRRQGPARYELLVDGRPAGGCTPTSSPLPQNWGTGPQDLTCTVLWTLRPGRHQLAAIESSRRPVSGPAIWITVAQPGD
jgi:membrane carboxypeptidase/penicillin-binding protein PbpC